MNSVPGVVMVVLSAALASVSQLLLKLSADKNHKNFLEEYLNPYVIVGYALMFSAALLNMLAMRFVLFKSVSALGALSYIFVMILGWAILKERLKLRQYLGAALIVLGIVIYNF